MKTIKLSIVIAIWLLGYGAGAAPEIRISPDRTVWWNGAAGNQYVLEQAPFLGASWNRIAMTNAYASDIISVPVSFTETSGFFRVMETSLIQLHEFGDVEWKFHLQFITPLTSGTWRVAVTNNDQSWGTAWSGGLTNAVIGVSDTGVSDTNTMHEYIGSNAVVSVTVQTPEGLFTLQTNALISKLFYAYEFLIGAEPGTACRDSLLARALWDMNEPGDGFNLESQTRELFPGDWNTLNSTNWGLFWRYLSGEFIQPAAAIYLALAENSTNFVLPENAVFQRKSALIIIDGKNIDAAELAAIKRLVGEEQLTRDQAMERGMRLRFALFFTNAPVGTFSSADHDEFVRKFLDAVFVGDWILGPMPYDMALAAASQHDDGSPNPVAAYARWVGCAQALIWEFNGFFPP